MNTFDKICPKNGIKLMEKMYKKKIDNYAKIS